MLGRGLLVYGDGQHTSLKVSESPPSPMPSPAHTSPPALCNGDMMMRHVMEDICFIPPFSLCRYMIDLVIC